MLGSFRTKVIDDACKVVLAIKENSNTKINIIYENIRSNNLDKCSLLSSFIFTVDEISTISKVSNIAVKAIIDSFIAPDKNDNFISIDDFNILNAYPIIPYNKSEYLLFHQYSLSEALYETPFFWFNSDQSYKNTASKHRGEFTESFSANRLKLVFGENRVFTNIKIFDSKKIEVGEIDVLVVFSDRAIVLQAKSKKLTVAARKGNDNCIQKDFKNAIQDSYNQGLSCAEFLIDDNYTLTDFDLNDFKINRVFKEIYLFCVVSDHYPALSFQARQFLKYQKTDIITSPFIMDVFLLDAMTEVLQTPLYFLDYISKRTKYIENVFTIHELTVLSYYLQYDLLFDNNEDNIHMDDSLSTDIDHIMMIRRDGLSGTEATNYVPDKHKNTSIGKIIYEIEKLEHENSIEFGLMLLGLDEASIKDINDGISKIINQVNIDGNNHDFSIGWKELKLGLTIHCNNTPRLVSESLLENHCRARKYIERANNWFGILLNPHNSKLEFLLYLNDVWSYSKEMERRVNSLKNPSSINRPLTKNKIDRNQPCPCGSGKKYKKCCMDSLDIFR
jgi:SEC-C motif/Nuclease-related domain